MTWIPENVTVKNTFGDSVRLRSSQKDFFGRTFRLENDGPTFYGYDKSSLLLKFLKLFDKTFQELECDDGGIYYVSAKSIYSFFRHYGVVNPNSRESLSDKLIEAHNYYSYYDKL